MWPAAAREGVPQAAAMFGVEHFDSLWLYEHDDLLLWVGVFFEIGLEQGASLGDGSGAQTEYVLLTDCDPYQPCGPQEPQVVVDR